MLSSLKIRIVLWYTLVVLLTLLAFRVITVQVFRRHLFDDLDSSLRAEAEWVLNTIHSFRGRRMTDEEIRREITARSILNPRKEFIEIYEDTGNLFYRSPNVLTGGILRPARSTPSDEAMTLPAFQKRPVRLLSRTDGPYQICVAYPLTDIEAAINRLVSSFFTLLPATLLLIAVGGVFLVSRFLRPIKGLSAYADDLLRQPLDAELEPPAQGKDEIGILVAQIHGTVVRMRNSMRQVLSFSSLASHELRTPLAIMRSELETALQPDLPPEGLRRIIASSYDEILRMSSTVDDLLSLGTMQAGTFRLNPSPISFRTLLKEFHEDAVHLVRGRNISVALDEGPDVMVSLDSSRMQQVLFNLLDNTARHGGGNCELRLAWSRKGDDIELEFSDSGCGIPPDRLARIFDPFYRGTAGNGGSPGTGLGLALVKRIIEAHGGTIGVESVAGSGTAFRIRLPIAAVSG